jgi:hypothetical protein
MPLLVDLDTPSRHIPHLFDTVHPLASWRTFRCCVYTETFRLLFVTPSFVPGKCMPTDLYFELTHLSTGFRSGDISRGDPAWHIRPTVTVPWKTYART